MNFILPSKKKNCHWRLYSTCISNYPSAFLTPFTEREPCSRLLCAAFLSYHRWGKLSSSVLCPFHSLQLGNPLAHRPSEMSAVSASLDMYLLWQRDVFVSFMYLHIDKQYFFAAGSVAFYYFSLNFIFFITPLHISVGNHTNVPVSSLHLLASISEEYL